MSSIERSHTFGVQDLQFIPSGVKVDKKHIVNGKSSFFVTCSEDCHIMIWDARHVEFENLEKE